MAQQIQFIYLTQSEYDALNPKNVGRIYFTSDTHRIYKGSDLYAATTFDQLNFSAITASSITVDGSAVALEGHTHPASDITGLEAAISGFASVGHTHSELSGITATSISKSGNITASVGTFYDINVTGTATFDATDIAATSVTVNGSNVSLEGHGHSVADIDGLGTTLQGFASSGHTHVELSGITSTSITKETGTFTNLVVANASITATSIMASGASVAGDVTANAVTASTGTFGNLVVSTANISATAISANSMTVNGSNVSLEGHTHSEYTSVGHTHSLADVSGAVPIQFMTSSAYSALASKDSGTIYFVDDNSIYKGSELYGAATFDQLNFSVIEATSLTVQGCSVALVGHTHPASEVTGLQSVLDGLSSTYALVSHSHAISDITNLSTILTGITESDIEKDTVTADIGYFRLLSVSGSANFAVNMVSANAVTVNGTSVALQGHGHSVADISDFGTALSAATSNFASVGHTHSIYAASDHNHDGTYASVSHSHGMSDITGLENTLSAFASSGHSHVELAGITSSTISKNSGDFVTLSASTATFETMTVSGSATFDITNLVADAITVSDLNLTGTLSVSSTAISAMTVIDMSVTGTLTLNSKSIATQEYVQLMISQAIGQILASAY